MSITYHIEVEHQLGPLWKRWLMPWRGRFWSGGYGRFDNGQIAYNHVNEALVEADAECKHHGDSVITGYWRIVRRSGYSQHDLQSGLRNGHAPSPMNIVLQGKGEV